MSFAENRPAHLEPSELGTKEYWDRLYAQELANHAADPSDIGTVWFDDSDAEAKVVAFLDRLAAAAPAPTPLVSLSRATASLLDLGCGNGSLLFALRAAGWAGPALGVDYSARSIALARQVAATSSARPVDFEEWDVVAGPADAVLRGSQRHGWDVVLDKGTFDAVSLSDERDSRARRPCDVYRDRVLRLVRPGGLFVVTSCNWTEHELTSWFAAATDAAPPRPSPPLSPGRPLEHGFEVAGTVHYATFSFGGAKGQTVSTVSFKKIVL